MQEVRIKYLQEEIEKFPDEPFNYYALALEYSKKDANQAKDFFEKTLVKFPDYLPTYYQAANFFFDNEDYPAADKIFLEGIKLAQQQNNAKTLKELQGSYSIFKSETEDEY